MADYFPGHDDSNCTAFNRYVFAGSAGGTAGFECVNLVCAAHVDDDDPRHGAWSDSCRPPERSARKAQTALCRYDGLYRCSLWLCSCRGHIFFLFFRFFMGVAGASGIVIARAIARDVCEGAELTRFFAVLMMVNGFAPIISPVIGGQILLFADWRATFVLLTVIGIFLAGTTLVYQETLPKESRSENMTDSLKKFPVLFRDRYFRGHCLLQCFVFGAFFSYLSGSSFIFQNIYAISPQIYSMIFAGIGAGLLIAGILPARLAGRIPDIVILKYSVLVPFAGSMLLLLGFYFSVSLAVILVLLFITIVPLSVMGAASFSLALSRQGKNAGSASALIGCFSMLLGACAMPLAGIAGDQTALPMGIIMVTGYGLGTLVFYRMIAVDHAS